MRLRDQESTGLGGAGGASGPDPAQRRFDRRMVGLTLVLVVALIAGLVAYAKLRSHPVVAPKPDARAEVEKAYNDWWAARATSFLGLDSTAVKPYMTAAGLAQEEKLIADQRGPNHPLRLSAEHNLQTVVYRDSETASVDDVWVNHSVDLDPTTLTPIQPDPQITLHDSTSLKKVNGRWLIDDVSRFGGSRPITGQDISYVAMAGGHPLPDALQKELETAYLNYWKVVASAYLALDPAALASVETGSALARDQSVMQADAAKKQAGLFDIQHNFRTATETGDVIWTYDTVEDRSVLLDSATRKPIKPAMTRIYRISLKFVKEASGWKVDTLTGE